jgi:hypothetical protein
MVRKDFEKFLKQRNFKRFKDASKTPGFENTGFWHLKLKSGGVCDSIRFVVSDILAHLEVQTGEVKKYEGGWKTVETYYFSEWDIEGKIDIINIVLRK